MRSIRASEWVLAGAIAVASVHGLVACSSPADSSAAADGSDAGSTKSKKDGGSASSTSGNKKKDAGAAHDGGDAATAADADVLVEGDGGVVMHDGGASCTTPLVAGDLEITELMIASQPGAGDHGEWIEIRNARDCTLNLKGISVRSPRGSAFDTASITTDTWLGPDSRFLVADSDDPQLNGNLPGVVIAFNGDPADVLANAGDQVSVELAGKVIASVAYNKSPVEAGASLALPERCPAGPVPAANAWPWSEFSWTSGKYGSPGFPNIDVPCP